MGNKTQWQPSSRLFNVPIIPHHSVPVVYVIQLYLHPFTAVVLSFAFLQPFGNILNLVPLAESVLKLNAVCMQCYKEAAYTKRLGAEKEVSRERSPAKTHFQ